LKRRGRTSRWESHFDRSADNSDKISGDTQSAPLCLSSQRKCVLKTLNNNNFTRHSFLPLIFTMASEKKRDDHVVDVGGSLDETPSTSALNNPTVALLCYCASSILMTVTNKYVLSGMDFNLNFLLLCIQSAVALLAIQTCKTVGIFHYRDFKLDEAKKCM